MRLGHLRQDDDQDAHESTGPSGEGRARSPPTIRMGFAREVADRVLMMDDGRIIEEGTPEHFFTNPTQERTKSFLSKIL